MSKKKNSKTQPERIKQDASQLPCVLTTEEILESGKKLANLTTAKDQLDAQKKRVGSDYKAKIDEKIAQISIETNKIETGIEHRVVNREAELNVPEQGKKTLYRTDTGEEIGVTDMTLQELQRELPLGDEASGPDPDFEVAEPNAFLSDVPKAKKSKKKKEEVEA